MATMRMPYNLEPAETCGTCDKRGGSFFCHLSDESLAALNEVSFVNTYPAGAILFVEGQMARGVYLLCKGTAKLTVVSAEGRTLIIKLAGPGEVLGMSACVKQREYETTVETMSPCEVNFIKMGDFNRLLQQRPDICLHAAEQMSSQVQNAWRELRWVGLSRSADWRVACMFLSWAEERGTNGPVPGFKMTLTHEGLAQMVGTTRETITRVIARFRRQGYIEVRGATILLSNKAALLHIAGKASGSQAHGIRPLRITRAAAERPISVSV